LAVVRTPASVIRLWDVLDLVRDPQVRVVFTINRTSEFSREVAELLTAQGVRPVLWEDLDGVDYDLVLTASEDVYLQELRDVPVIVIPHGIGFHRYVPDGASGTRLTGVVPPEARRRRRVLQVVTHPDQAAQLDPTMPTLVTGDPCYDRILASTHRRPEYRRALGVDDRALVLVSSTWGEQSLIGDAPDLPAQLLGELPADSYRVATVLHPNVWAKEGGHRIRSVLGDALDAGLLLTDDWQAALIASDVVIGDHGSITFYAAALGKPLLLGAFGTDIVPDTPLDILGALAPRLDRGQHLVDQVAKSALTFQELGRTAISNTGDAAFALRDLLYTTLGLTSPDVPARILSYPDPVAEQRPVHSYLVYEADGEMWRIPVAVAVEDGASHIAVTTEERDLGLRRTAAVVARQELGPLPEQWIAKALYEHPDAELVATAIENGCLVGFRDGRIIAVALRRDPLWTASDVYTRQ
jgi:hypothetical protein